MTSNMTRNELITSIEKYFSSGGKVEDYSAVHNIVLKEVGQATLESAKVIGSSTKKRKEMMSNREDVHFSIISKLFEKDIDEWRREESFKGSNAQLQYIRDILLCDCTIINDSSVL